MYCTCEIDLKERYVVLCVVVIIEGENWRTCVAIVCVRERGLEEPFMVLGVVILCERGRGKESWRSLVWCLA